MAFYTRVIEHTHQDLRLVKVTLIMLPKIVLADPFAQLDDDWPEPVQLDAPILLCAKYKWFTLFQEQRLYRFRAFFSKDLECSVIEYITVLIDLKEGGAFVSMAPDEHLLQMFRVPVHTSCYKS